MFMKDSVNELRKQKISKTLKKRFSLMTKEQIKKRNGNNGIKNGMFGRKLIDVWIEKYGKNEAELRYKKWLKKLSKKDKQLKHTDATIIKIRIAKIERVKSKLKNGISPRYNPEACKIINFYSKKFGYNFQYAENGREVFVPVSAYLDGYDKKKNTVIEYYEKRHYTCKGELLKKDLQREQLIIKHLKCSFIRINAYDKNNLKFEKIA